jgi:hypothetical protein
MNVRNVRTQLHEIDGDWRNLKVIPSVDHIKSLVTAVPPEQLDDETFALAHILAGIALLQHGRPAYDQALIYFAGQTNLRTRDTYRDWFELGFYKKPSGRYLRARMAFNYELTTWLGKRSSIDRFYNKSSKMLTYVSMANRPDWYAKAMLLFTAIFAYQQHANEAKETASRVDAALLPAHLEGLRQHIQETGELSPIYSFLISDLL